MRRSARLGVFVFLAPVLGACVETFDEPALIVAPKHAPCGAPTDIETSDYWLRFKVPRGLMPGERCDHRHAERHVHRVRPVYADKKCEAPKVAVLIHGRSVPGEPVFDLDFADGALSVQEKLARAGIDTFAPDMLGYG